MFEHALRLAGVQQTEQHPREQRHLGVLAAAQGQPLRVVGGVETAEVQGHQRGFAREVGRGWGGGDGTCREGGTALFPCWSLREC